MIRYMINCCVLIVLLFSSLSWADVFLPGKFYIGNNNGDALLPTVMVRQSGGLFIPVAPINFSLSETLTISEVKLDGAAGLDAGVNVVIWNENADVLFDKKANDLTPSLISSPISLPAGEYKMAVWGGCFKNGIYQGRYQSNCSDWDDFQFNGIRLVSAGISDAFHFIERTHLGDNSDGSRWYPPSPSGTYVKNLFTLNQKSKLKNLSLFNLRDWGVPNGSRMFIRTQGSVDTPLVFYFSGNGEVNWPIEYELAAGTYELWLETLGRGDLDDISWDDIILRYEPSPQQNDFSALCKQAFPYPAQGRAANHQIDLSGSEWSLMGLIKGTTRGALGYKNSGQIRGDHPQSCDGGRCLPSDNTANLSFPAFPSSWPTSPNIGIQEGVDRYLTAADGKSFGTISTKNGSSLDIRQAGLTINTLDLGSGRNGKPYTVRLAAGDYWIKTLKMYDNTLIEVAGPVRLFVENVTMIGASFINSTGANIRGDIGKLLLVTYNTLDMGAQATISGLVYQQEGGVGSFLNMGSPSYIHGRVSSPKIKVGMNSVIDSSGYSCGGSQNQVDHYELHYGAQTLTCEVATVQLKACANGDCSTLYDLGANVTLSPTQGWSSNPVVIGASGSDALNLQRYQAGAIPLSIVTATPAAPLRCFKDGVLDANCSISFVDAALRFNVPTFYAGTSGVTSIRAIKSNDAGATKVCVPLLTGDQTLQFASSKVVSEASGAVPMVNSTVIAPSGNVKVAFNSDGVGQLTVQYPDAGVLRLDATFQKNDVTGTLKLTGSDTVAVIPKAITLQAQEQSSCSGSNDNTYAACPVYRKAGESFTLQARALNEQDQLTPGFATSNKAISWALLAPAAGGTGTFSPTAISLANGVANNVVANWSEVGVIRLGVSNFVPYPAYQDELPQLETVLRWSEPIGRFVPWDYSLSGGFITPACNAFTYMSQPFASGFVLTARNSQQGTTQNYQGAFAKGVAEMVAANALDGVDRSGRITQAPTLSWASGIASVNQQSPFGLNTRFDRATGPEAPFATLSFGIKVDDKDGGTTLLANPNMNTAVAGSCAGASCDAVRLGTQKLLYGRLLAGTEAGVASAPLAIPLKMQYYEAGNWQPNKEDQCTRLSLAADGIRFLNPGHSFDAASRDLNLGAGRKIKLGLGSSAPGGEAAQAKDGEILFHFAKPDISVRIPYKVDLAKQPLSPLWLSDPASANDGNLQGEAIFGSSRGNDRIIYRREVLH
ncbi:hypothetical protein Q7I35_10425 [Aeromonas allosaccharophila]|uniref:DUF6701 domain-containing protein n=1 Tax=Aeromonas veronii TaxID=654 RepID=A0A6S5D5F4_AERVE|nr:MULTISPECIES: DUF6701 domain-containing protein [Aeromonas]BBR38063.1 hypothetical protein WP3W19E03_05880 [Aeromonas veronii]